MKRCGQCGRDATSGVTYCPECHEMFQNLGIHCVQTGLHKGRIFIPENTEYEIIITPATSSFRSELRKTDYKLWVKEILLDVKSVLGILKREVLSK